MPNTTVADRKASADNVRSHAAALRKLARRAGLGPPRLRDDGTVIVHSDQPGYRAVLAFSALASQQVGGYVHVITDDAPAAHDAKPL